MMGVKFKDQYEITLGPASRSSLCVCGSWISAHGETPSECNARFKVVETLHNETCEGSPRDAFFRVLNMEQRTGDETL